jgi:poly(A) polymerase
MIVQEFRAADAIIGSIMYGKKSWTDLFTYHTFFTKDHKYYLSVIAACRTKEAQESFSGLVQSKVRGIVKGIDEGQAGVEIARPFPHEFRRVHRCKTEDQIDEICQGKMDWHVASKDVENGTDAEQEHFLVYTTTWYIGLTLPEGILLLELKLHCLV